MAHKKAGGSSKNGRDSNAQRRGVKLYGGQKVKAGGIIVRQVGGYGFPEGLRITVGDAEQTGQVIDSLSRWRRQAA